MDPLFQRIEALQRIGYVFRSGCVRGRFYADLIEPGGAVGISITGTSLHDCARRVVEIVERQRRAS